MKKLVTLTLVLILSIGQLVAQEPADKLIADALSKAKSENKNVFVKFSASWCYWCRKLDSYLNSEPCQKFFKANYVIVTLIANEMFIPGEIDRTHLENPGANELLQKYGSEKADMPMKIFGMPFWYIINQEGELLEDAFDVNGENLSCPTKPESVEKFIKKLSRTSNITETDIQAIRKTFILKH
ncbi:MAG: thioredoxin family protein [Cyclobacteriaceae bacterium]